MADAQSRIVVEKAVRRDLQEPRSVNATLAKFLTKARSTGIEPLSWAKEPVQNLKWPCVWQYAV